MQETLRRLIGQVSPALAGKAIDSSVSLLELGLDSLDHANLLLAVEEEFSVKVLDEEAGQLVTVNSLVKFLKDQGVKV